MFELSKFNPFSRKENRTIQPEKIEPTEKVVAESGPVKLSLIQSKINQGKNSLDESYHILFIDPATGQENIVGSRRVIVSLGEKRIYLSDIEVDSQWHGRGIGTEATLALVDYLNQRGMTGWEVTTVATNRGFNEKIMSAVFSATEQPGGWDLFKGKVLPTIEARENLAARKRAAAA